MMSHKSSRAQQTLLHATAADNAYSEMPCKERYVNRTGRLHKKQRDQVGTYQFSPVHSDLQTCLVPWPWLQQRPPQADPQVWIL